MLSLGPWDLQLVPSKSPSCPSPCGRARRARKELEAASNVTSQSEAQEVMLANLSSFTRHDSFYELCGLLGTKDIERST